MSFAASILRRAAAAAHKQAGVPSLLLPGTTSSRARTAQTLVVPATGGRYHVPAAGSTLVRTNAAVSLGNTSSSTTTAVALLWTDSAPTTPTMMPASSSTTTTNRGSSSTATAKSPLSIQDTLRTKALVDHVATTHDLSLAESRRIIDTILDGVLEHIVAGKKVHLAGFGTFEKMYSKETTATNPRTGEKVDVPAKYRVRFRAAAELKRNANGETSSKAAT